MIYKIFFFILFCHSIELYCSQSTNENIDLSEWIDISQDSEEITQSIEDNSTKYLDLNSEFFELRKNAKEQFVQAHIIIKGLRNQLEDLGQNEEKYLPINEQLISTANRQIKELQNLAHLLEIKNNIYNYNINNSINQYELFDPRNGSLSSLFSTYVVRAEVIFSEIFKTTQELGVPLDDDPNNI